MAEIFIPKPAHMVNLDAKDLSENTTVKNIENILEKDKQNDSQLPEDINMNYMINPYSTSVISRNKLIYKTTLIKEQLPETKPSNFKLNSIYNKSVMQDGLRKGKYTGAHVDTYQLNGIKESVPKNTIYEGDFTEKYNKSNYKYRYGKQDQINKEVNDKAGINYYLTLGYNNQYKDLQNRGVYGRLGGQPYAGFQEWENDNPMIKRNLAVDYTTIGSPALG